MTETTQARAVERVSAREARASVPWNRILLYLLLIAIALFFVVPLIWMVSTSLKAESAVISDTDILGGFIPSNPTLSNYEFILTASGNTPVFRWMINSFVVAGAGGVLARL